MPVVLSKDLQPVVVLADIILRYLLSYVHGFGSLFACLQLQCFYCCRVRENELDVELHEDQNGDENDHVEHQCNHNEQVAEILDGPGFVLNQAISTFRSLTIAGIATRMPIA